MKLHDLQPARGAHQAKTRVGRGIAGGKGKTAGRGTKGQKARAGGSIPPWFEGGQTPIHIRIPKLRGFKNRGKLDYEVVNLGRINQLVELGVFEPGDMPGAKPARSGKSAPITVNQEILRASGLVSTLSKPLKILGQGEVSVALFVVADKFSKSAVGKIEAAGGSVQVLQVASSPMAAMLGAPTGTSEAKVSKRAAAKVAGAAKAAAITQAVAAKKAAPRAPKAAPTAKAGAAKKPARTAEGVPSAKAGRPAGMARTAETQAGETAPAAGTDAAEAADVAETPAARTPAAKRAPAAETGTAAPSGDEAPKRSRRKASGDDAGGAA
jgi:large subunit ribosomal protein L15